MSQPVQNVSYAICGKQVPARETVSGALIREEIASVIRSQQPDWSAASSICIPDLTRFRSEYVQSLLQDEIGDLTSLEREVLSSLREHEILSSNIETGLRGKK